MSRFVEADDSITTLPVASSSRSRKTTGGTTPSLGDNDDYVSKAAGDMTPAIEEPLLVHRSSGTRARLARAARTTRPIWRRIRWLLGPAHPIPDPDLPQPAESLSLSFTTPRKSYSSQVDGKMARFSTRFRLRWALWPFLALWMMGYILLIRQQWWPPGAPDIIGCTAAVWSDWPPDSCGVNGTSCEQYLYDGQYRCLGGCRDVTLGNPRWIGGEEVNGVPLIVGGGDGNTYRGDSWVCAAAIHARLIHPTMGGCISLTALPFSEGAADFPSSTSNGLTSAAFRPFFPGAYTLARLGRNGCLDLHPIVSTYNAICLFLLTALTFPSPWILMHILVFLGYTQIVFISNPRSEPPDWEYVFSSFGPVIFVGYWAYRVSFKRTIEGFRRLPFELAFWQGTGFWIGIESSQIFSRLPITRLGYDALDPAGVITLVIILVIVVIVALIQAWTLRKVGLLQYYLVRYLPIVPILIVLANLGDNQHLRIHHYMYALLAIPVLSLPNRVSLFFQAFMLGLFLDGVGRWGWASIVETTDSLRGDANAGTFTPSFSNTSDSTEVAWSALNETYTDQGITGFSLIVDDIQRLFNVNESSIALANLSLTEGIEHYFRLAYVQGGAALDYINPATLLANGSWSLGR